VEDFDYLGKNKLMRYQELHLFYNFGFGEQAQFLLGEQAQGGV